MSIRLDDEIYCRLHALATTERRSLNQMINCVIKRYDEIKNAGELLNRVQTITEGRPKL
jgi:predicted transcriptional regulator